MTAIQVVVTYGAPPDPAAFLERYASVHVPLVEQIPGLARFAWGTVERAPEESNLPYLVAELTFDSRQAMSDGMGGDHGRAAAADGANFSIKPSMAYRVELLGQFNGPDRR